MHTNRAHFSKIRALFCKIREKSERGVAGETSHPPSALVAQQGFCNKVSATLLKKETLAQVFSCEFCEIFKGTFFIEHLWASTSDNAFIDILHYYSAPVKYIFRQVSVQANINLIWYVHR